MKHLIHQTDIGAPMISVRATRITGDEESRNCLPAGLIVIGRMWPMSAPPKTTKIARQGIPVIASNILISEYVPPGTGAAAVDMTTVHQGASRQAEHTHAASIDAGPPPLAKV